MVQCNLRATAASKVCPQAQALVTLRHLSTTSKLMLHYATNRWSTPCPAHLDGLILGDYVIDVERNVVRCFLHTQVDLHRAHDASVAVDEGTHPEFIMDWFKGCGEPEVHFFFRQGRLIFLLLGRKGWMGYSMIFFGEGEVIFRAVD